MSDPQAAFDAGGAEIAKPFGDAVSIGVAIATIADWLPAIAALLTVVWTAIRILETKTVQRLLRRRGGGPAKCQAAPGDSDGRVCDSTRRDRLER